MRIALGLEYDGSAFCGWQTQPGGCAVQDHLQRALREFTRQDVETVAAGRTDAGVHASAQVVHHDTEVHRESH
jgi:tRNA pseudouridine38-40 synthase